MPIDAPIIAIVIMWLKEDCAIGIRTCSTPFRFAPLVITVQKGSWPMMSAEGRYKKPIEPPAIKPTIPNFSVSQPEYFEAMVASFW